MSAVSKTCIDLAYIMICSPFYTSVFLDLAISGFVAIAYDIRIALPPDIEFCFWGISSGIACLDFFIFLIDGPFPIPNNDPIAAPNPPFDFSYGAFRHDTYDSICIFGADDFDRSYLSNDPKLTDF